MNVENCSVCVGVNLKMCAMSILVVEDDSSVNRAIQAALTANGFCVKSAETCAEGFSLASSEIPALLVLDLELPDGTGWGLLNDIRNASHQDESEEFKVIVISSTRVTRAQIRDNRIAKFLAKPFDMGYFVETVSEVLAAPR